MQQKKSNKFSAFGVPPTFLLWRHLFTLPLYSYMKQIFIMKKDIPLHTRFLKLVYSEEKIASVCF